MRTGFANGSRNHHRAGPDGLTWTVQPRTASPAGAVEVNLNGLGVVLDEKSGSLLAIVSRDRDDPRGRDRERQPHRPGLSRPRFRAAAPGARFSEGAESALGRPRRDRLEGAGAERPFKLEGRVAVTVRLRATTTADGRDEL